MSVIATVLFGRPQQEVGTLLLARMTAASSIWIVTGFATPGGFGEIRDAIQAGPKKLSAMVLGAATYPGFKAMDAFIAAGVPMDRLHVHLGHTCDTGGKRNPVQRYHPMLHSKIYFMEFADGSACAFIGSHNLTSFALSGLNGEASVLLEGPATSPEFTKVRTHINEAIRQAIPYTPDLKEALAWWTREYLDGLRAEVRLPVEWSITRTILVFAQASRRDIPRLLETLYFEIPAGIEKIESLSTQTHLFLFESMPSDPWMALQRAEAADAAFTCTTLGADNLQGNREVASNWIIDGTSPPRLLPVLSGLHRPRVAAGMQQVRARIDEAGVVPYDYRFDRESKEWMPDYSDDGEDQVMAAENLPQHRQLLLARDRDTGRPRREWKLVKGLRSRERGERDQLALELASPEAGVFLLVSLRRRKKADSESDDRSSS